jgi:hypothetical protein
LSGIHLDSSIAAESRPGSLSGRRKVQPNAWPIEEPGVSGTQQDRLWQTV